MKTSLASILLLGLAGGGVTAISDKDAKPALLFDTGTLTSCLQIDMTKSLVLDSCDCKTDVTAKSDKTWNEVKLDDDTFQLESTTHTGLCVGAMGCSSGIKCPDGGVSAPTQSGCDGADNFPSPDSYLELVNCTDGNNALFYDPNPILPPDGDDSLCVVTYRSKTCDNMCLRSDYFSQVKQPAVWIDCNEGGSVGNYATERWLVK